MKSLQLILTHLKCFAPVWVFASLNIITGTWVLYLPYIKTKFSLTDGDVGMALFCIALGSLVAIPIVPFVTQKIGVGKATIIGIIMYALLFNIPLIAPSFLWLGVSLFFTGVFSGFTDVAMNSLVATIENNDANNFMSAAHGFFSLGGFIGAAIGSLLMGTIVSPFWHMLLVFCFVVVTNLILAKKYIHIKDVKVSNSSKKVRGFNKLRPLAVLALVAFIIMCNEGAVEHWSNLFLFDIVKVAENIAGLGFIAFSLGMTLGRFLGDGVSETYGAVKVILLGCTIAIVSYGFILTSNLYVSVLGFGLLGLGLSVIIPEIFRLAGRSKDLPTSVAISFVSGIGFLGFLLGPVIIGFISNKTSLVSSYIFLGVLVAVAFILTFFKFNPNKKQER